MKYMSKAMRYSRSFTIDAATLGYIQHTRAHRSHSERVNELLRRAIQQERYEALEKEAAEFYRTANKKGRAEAKAFAAAGIRSMTREEK